LADERVSPPPEPDRGKGDGGPARSRSPADQDGLQGQRRTGGERGKRASFDPHSGAVHGSGSDAGGKGNPDENYDQDAPAGSGGAERDISRRGSGGPSNSA
jgi:hypothetical protein